MKFSGSVTNKILLETAFDTHDSSRFGGEAHSSCSTVLVPTQIPCASQVPQQTEDYQDEADYVQSHLLPCGRLELSAVSSQVDGF